MIFSLPLHYSVLLGLVIIIVVILVSIKLEKRWMQGHAVLCYFFMLSFIIAQFLHFHNAIIPEWSTVRLIEIGRTYDPAYSAMISSIIWSLLTSLYYKLVVSQPSEEVPK